ncbi:MAG: ThuA domain-containing protein [Bryobacteraceae bacterium]
MRLIMALFMAGSSLATAAPRLQALIVDGQNNHAWQQTTPVLKRLLEETGLFMVDVATTPPLHGDFSAFRPDFRKYRVVVSNYNGEAWPAEVQTAFESYVRGGGGFVVYHAADNAFPEWPQYNEMIALGGWGARNEKAGPYLRYRDGKISLDPSPGPGGHHGKQHAFVVAVRDRDHPVTRGLPEKWMHAQDELYDRLRGPAKNLTLLATAWSDPSTNGTGEHEPMLLTVKYGKGRIFHTTLGHGLEAMRCTGFIVTYQRGTEWAASGKVSQPVPPDFPGQDRVSLR